MSYLANAAVFLIQTLFDFAIGLMLARAWLIYIGAPFHEPASQFVYRLTNPLLAPLRKLLPRRGRIDVAALLVALALALVELGLLTLIIGLRFSVPGWLLGALVAVAGIAVSMLFWAIVLRCVLSFFVSEYDNDAMRLLVRCTEPVVAPFRRLVPNIAGLDLSCWIASLALILVRLLILAPLADFAARI